MMIYTLSQFSWEPKMAAPKKPRPGTKKKNRRQNCKINTITYSKTTFAVCAVGKRRLFLYYVVPPEKNLFSGNSNKYKYTV